MKEGAMSQAEQFAATGSCHNPLLDRVLTGDTVLSGSNHQLLAGTSGSHERLQWPKEKASSIYLVETMSRAW